MIAWLRAHEILLLWLGFGSVVLFFGTLAAVPWLVARIPVAYFTRDQRPASRWQRLPAAQRALLQLAKNALGAVLVAAGVAMLVLPGQGILTILLGVMLLDFPGKYALECWLVGWPAVFRSVNWMRQRAGVLPLAPPPGYRA